MYNAEFLSDRIKLRARARGVMLKEMLVELDLNINTISQITNKKGLACFSLARIADYLDCSMDYLLGRTDVPEVNR